MAILIRLLGDDSPLAAQMCEGKNERERKRAMLF
jgi:hypothetical protein